MHDPMSLSLIGPERHQSTRLGAQRRARLWLALADAVGLAVGAAIAAAVILKLLL